MSKFSNPKRYAPDYHVSISHIQAYMRETEADKYGYIKGELYDELLSEYRKLTLIGTLKKHLVQFLEKHIWKLIVIYCVGALVLLVWFIGWVIL